MALISIVLPVYNGARYLSESIQSCINQTHADWELIIVDDCSTDETPEIITSFAARDRRIRSVRHETNQKLPGALNTGFALSRGEFLTWTSDDNLYRPQALELMAGYFNSNPACDFVYSDYSIIDKNRQFVRLQIAKNPEKLAFGCIIGPSFLYRRAVFEKVGKYDNAMFYVEDYDYWLRAARYFKMDVLHQDLYLYREHGGSLTAQKHITIQTKILQTKQKNLWHIPWISHPVKSEAFLVMSVSAWAQKRHELAVLYFFCAFFQQPARIFHKFLKS